LDHSNFPRLPNNLVSAIKATLPANKPMPGESLDAIMFRAGQWGDMIRFDVRCLGRVDAAPDRLPRTFPRIVT